MLVLSRKEGERIIMDAPSGDRITIAVVGERGGKVRIGIEAPVEYTVNREEVQAHVDAGRPCLPHPTGINL